MDPELETTRKTNGGPLPVSRRFAKIRYSIQPSRRGGDRERAEFLPCESNWSRGERRSLREDVGSRLDI